MFTNPKELDGYWKTAWWLEWIEYSEEKEIDEDGVETITKTQGHFSDKPIEFRYKTLETTKEEFSQMANRLGVDVSERIETRSKLSIKQEDLILSNLETLPDTQTNRNGLRYANWSRVANVKIMIDTDDSMTHLMFNTTNDEVKEIMLG